MEITKKADYNETTNFGEGGFKSLPKGGYVVKIFKAEIMTNKIGDPMVHIAFDIVDGEYQGYFMGLWKSRKENAKDKFKEVKYPFEGQAWIGTTDYEDRNKTSRQFKGFCTAVEDSGTVIWNGNLFNVKALEGAMVGVIYQNQEQEYNNERYWRAVPWAYRNVDSIREGDFFVPKDKALPEKTENVMMSEGFQKVNDSDIPF